MKNFYIACTVMGDKNESILHPDNAAPVEVGYYAYIVKVSENDNIKAALDNIGGLIHANIFSSMKKAKEVIAMWNDSYKNNGSYLFDSPKF